MAEKSQKRSNIPNLTTQKSKSHSRRISTIPNHHKDISFMSKFLIKNLQRKKHHHRRQPSIVFPSGIKPDNEKIPDSNPDHETRGKRPIVDKKGPKTNQLMPKNVGAFMSILFRNKKKSSDKDYSLVKQGSVSAKCVLPSYSSLFRDKKHGLTSVKGKAEKEVSCSEKTLVGKSLSRLRTMEVKPGLRIKGLTRIVSREKDDKRVELCKKKILMGEKCKPLSGMLRYDHKGVLVPEDLP